MPAPTQPSPGVALTALYGLLLIDGAALAGFVAGLPGWWGGMALMFVTPLPMLMLTGTLDRPALIGAVIGAFGLQLGASVVAPDLARALRQPVEARGLALAEAAAHPDADVLAFTDARVRPDLGASITTTSQGRNGQQYRSTTTVSALVPEGWTPDQPVPAWAEGRPAACPEALRPAAHSRDSLRAASLRAARTHQLAAAPDAPILACAPDARAALRDRLPAALRVAGAVNAIWLVGYLLVALVRRRA